MVYVWYGKAEGGCKNAKMFIILCMSSPLIFYFCSLLCIINLKIKICISYKKLNVFFQFYFLLNERIAHSCISFNERPFLYFCLKFYLLKISLLITSFSFFKWLAFDSSCFRVYCFVNCILQLIFILICYFIYSALL